MPSLTFIFSLWLGSFSGPRSILRGFSITLRHTTLGRIPLKQKPLPESIQHT